MEKKKFGETKVGQFLKKAAPAVLGIVGDVLPQAKVLTSLFRNQPDISEADKLQFEKLVQEYEQVELAAYMADMSNAREMQKSALAQEDVFSKRFIYYLAAFVVTLTFVFDLMMFFVHYPEANRDMINQVSGIINSGALIMILSFFYGSSKSSQDKQKILEAKGI